MAIHKAGHEIDAYCTKCKMDLLHRIVAVAGGKPARVECRTCKTTHNYRAAKGVESPGAAPRVIRSTGSSRVLSSRRAPAKTAPAPITPPANAHIFVYKIADRFAADTWVQHKQFGIGRVVREIAGDKVEIDFAGDVRVLVHGRT